MPRLRYSSNGLVRALQVSSADFVIFIEGKLDRPFCSFLFDANPALLPSSPIFRRCEEIDPKFGSGKNALLGFHRYLKRTNRLVIQLASTRKIVAFFLDRDVDGYFRRLSRSRHIVYTCGYSVENYVYRHGDFKRVLCAVGSLDISQVQTLPSNDFWCDKAAESWCDWIAFSFMCLRYKPNGMPSIGVPSVFHPSPQDPKDTTLEFQMLQAFASRTGKKVLEVQAIYDRYRKRISKIFDRRGHDSVFNGKWYAVFLAAELVRRVPGSATGKSLTEKLTQQLLTTLDFRADWSEPLRQRIRTIATL